MHNPNPNLTNAKHILTLLNTSSLPLHTQNTIQKLNNILTQLSQTSFHISSHHQQNPTPHMNPNKIYFNEYDIYNQKQNMIIPNDFSSKIYPTTQQNIQKIRNEQDVLRIIVREIDEFLSKKDLQGQLRNEQYGLGDNTIEIKQIYTLLNILRSELQERLHEEDKSNHSCNSQSNCNQQSNSNSNSIRSLLTQKLKQFTLQGQDDPEQSCPFPYPMQRVQIRCNLMRELNKCSKVTPPLMISRKYQEMTQPFSLNNQNKNNKQKGWRKQGRVRSQRTILGELNLSQVQVGQKRVKREEGGCSRCEIY